MEQFKKLYKPIIKPVKPGEKMAGVSKAEMPKFDFTKKFAKILIQETSSSLPTHQKSEENTIDLANVSLPDQEVDLKSPITARPSSTTERFTFSPAGLPKLNFARPGLLQTGGKDQAVNKTDDNLELLSVNETKDEGSSSDLLLSEITDDFEEAMLEFDKEKRKDQTLSPSLFSIEQQKEMIDTDTNTDASRDVEMLVKETIPITLESQYIADGNGLEQVLDLRGTLANLETTIVALEAELPIAMAMFDEKIAMLHNLRLDFLLDLGNDDDDDKVLDR